MANCPQRFAKIVVADSATRAELAKRAGDGDDLVLLGTFIRRPCELDATGRDRGAVLDVALGGHGGGRWGRRSS